jgi:anti-anti-sigma regulatory factor
MDTSAAAMLVELLRCVSQAGRAFRLKGLKEEHKRLLRLTRLSQVFGIDDNDFRESV